MGRDGRGGGAAAMGLGRRTGLQLNPTLAPSIWLCGAGKAKSRFTCSYGPHQNPVSALMDDLDGTSGEG